MIAMRHENDGVTLFETMSEHADVYKVPLLWGTIPRN